MNQQTWIRTAALATAATLAAHLHAGTPVGTAFTYQGELNDQGAPATGPHDLAFRLWDDPSAGTQVGTTQTLNDVQVVNGLFNVKLDFGAGVFDGDARWLEITVEGFVLSPRQPVTPSPYSIQTRGIFVDQDLNIGLGTTSPAADLDIVDDDTSVRVLATTTDGPHVQLQSTYDGVATATLGSLDFVNSSFETKAAVTGLQTLFGTRLHMVTEGTERLSIDQLGNVGIGTALPFTTLHVDPGDGVVSNFALHTDDIVLDDSGGDEAILGLYSDDLGTYGSALTFTEVLNTTGIPRNRWAIFRETTLSGSRLKFSFGPVVDHTQNPTVLCLTENGGIEYPDGTVQTSAPGPGIVSHEYRSENPPTSTVPADLEFIAPTAIMTITEAGQRIHVIGSVRIGCSGLDDCDQMTIFIGHRPAGSSAVPTFVGAGASFIVEDISWLTRAAIIEDLPPGDYEVGLIGSQGSSDFDEDLYYSNGDVTAFVF